MQTAANIAPNPVVARYTGTHNDPAIGNIMSVSENASHKAHENPAHENRLAQETSPYLLQHKHNPVDWWAWGPAALAEAKSSNADPASSVGYAACHWCHVMAHESFEDDATAAVMNELFVNIKVDREEQPGTLSTHLHVGVAPPSAWRLVIDHVLTPVGGKPFLGRQSISPQGKPLRPRRLRRRAAPRRAHLPGRPQRASNTTAAP